MNTTRRRLALFISGMAVASLPSPAFSALEEVIVTARKTEETVQTVPVALTTLTSDMMNQIGANDIRDVSAITPNLNVTGAAGGNPVAVNFNLRGQIQNDNLITLDPSVGLYVDDVYMARSFGSVLDLVDMERIEVLKGPQGTLYGRNTTGGAVKVITNKADVGAGMIGALRAEIGNYDWQKYTGFINVPLTDTIAARFSGMWKDRNGYETAYFPTGGKKDAATDSGNAGRLNLTWHTTENLTIYGSADWFRTDETGSITLSGGGDTVGTPATATIPGVGILPTAALGITSPFSAQHQHDFWSGLTNHVPKAIAEGGGASITADHAINQDISQKLIIAYRKVDSDFGRFDVDGSAFDFVSSRNIQDQDQLTAEYQILGAALDDKLDWVTGLYYFRETGHDDTLTQQNVTPANLINPSFSPSAILSYAENKSRSAFANASYHFTDEFSVNLGVRYTWDDKALDKEARGAANVCQLPSGGARCIEHSEVSDDFPSWQIGVDYRITPEIFTYAKISQASRSGGLQIRSVGLNTAPPPFDRETARETEVGIKSDLFDNRMRLNIAFFHNDYSDVQFSSIIPRNDIAGATTVAVVNLSDATVDGYEVELTALLTDELTLQTSYGHNKTDFDRPGLVRSYSPETKASASLNYEHAMTTGTLRARIGYTYTDEFLTSEVESRIDTMPYLTLPSYHLIDARLGFEFTNGIDISLWGKNLSEEEYYTRGIQVAGAFAPQDRGSPRTYGVEVGYKF